MPILVPETFDSEDSNVQQKPNFEIYGTKTQNVLKNEFDEALFPIRIMVTSQKKRRSFLQMGATLRETVESAPVNKFEHLANVDSYMIEMSEDCSREDLDSLIKDIKELGCDVEFDTLAQSAVQSVRQTIPDRPNTKNKQNGIKYNKKQWYIPEMNVENAWKEVTGADTRDVKVCVIDSGLDYIKEFTGRLAVEENEQNNTDSKESTSVLNKSTDSKKEENLSTLVSANFVDENFDPMDKLGHGTHLSSIISSRYGRSNVAGISPSALIIPCKAFDSVREIRLSNIVRCIDFCLYYEAEIQNHSWISNKQLKFLRRAFETAHKRGVIMVVPAGNVESPNKPSFLRRHYRRVLHYDLLNIDMSCQFPASYSRMFPNVISVSNLMRLDKTKSKDMVVTCMMNHGKHCEDLGDLGLNEQSMYGEMTVQVAAPGTNIYSVFLPGSHAFVTGTSSATAMVTGILSIIKSIFPKSQSHLDIHNDFIKTVQILRESVRPVPDLKGKVGWRGFPDCEVAVKLTMKFLQGLKKTPIKPRSRRRLSRKLL
ncbi:uncharacterized protein TOT_020000555 [Theileria orientalis strain Shintoku]|uniref:subtilisin n=1 Tax=Theileria orientalis strain Shintoku TaxID=869250 RepID=J4C3E4_THEOR|nr:uncharacterized protein TOT_020000555 [Theileria orientalis strain Shintoku]BAM40296.1 uncharacterized protein TOT_020000555 [Theileria orientalis strain Shintoku]|eukprot:XP_009690597.1 uncharacterized protein TOT_020000555 [Theileria orientalis strain Shintoku]